MDAFVRASLLLNISPAALAMALLRHLPASASATVSVQIMLGSDWVGDVSLLFSLPVDCMLDLLVQSSLVHVQLVLATP